MDNRIQKIYLKILQEENKNEFIDWNDKNLDVFLEKNKKTDWVLVFLQYQEGNFS